MPISGHAELQLGIRPLNADYLSPIPPVPHQSSFPLTPQLYHHTGVPQEWLRSLFLFFLPNLD